MKIDNPFSLLTEAAKADIIANTEGAITESQIMSRLDSIEEVSKDIIIPPEMVPVISMDECYLVEMNSIAGYMKSVGITSIAEALDNVAYANNLSQKQVGLLVESDDYIRTMLEKADAKCKKDCDKKEKNKVLDKIKKSTDITEKLKKAGYTVKKKKSKNAK